MRNRVAISTSFALAAATLAIGPPATAILVEAAGNTYSVCKFSSDPFGYAKANPRYPFGFLLTTSRQATSGRNVRKAVRSIQAVLARAGFSDESGREVIVDGSYGPQTASAVRTFQRKKRLIVDGKVGPQTWKKLSKYCWYFH